MNIGSSLFVFGVFRDRVNKPKLWLSLVMLNLLRCENKRIDKKNMIKCIF